MDRQNGNRSQGSTGARAALIAAVLGTLLAVAPPAGAVDFSGPTDYTAGYNEVSLVMGDFNADGDPDLASVEYAGGVNVLLGGAGGSFTGPTSFPLAGGGYTSGVALGQFNATDTDPDLAIASTSGVEILRGSAGGTFAVPLGPYPAGNSPTDVAVDSFDGDSDPDLAVANYYSGDVSILHGGAGATFGAPTSYSLGGPAPVAIATGNFNGDAYRDVVTANSVYTTNRLSVLLGGPSGLGTPTHYNAGDAFDYYQADSLAIGDFNGDADPDIAVANRNSDDVSILLGSTGGSFIGPTNLPLAAGSYSSGVALGKFNADTDPDLVVADWTNSGGDIAVLLGGTGGTFGAPSYFPASLPAGVVVGDFDADADDDVATASYGNGDISILLQVNTVGYARPQSATPATFRLVPAFTACTSPDGTHGLPKNEPSCNPPVQSSSFLTWNASDRPAPYNTPVNGTGYLRMVVFCTNGQAPPCPAVGDQEDVQLISDITDVRCVSAGPNCAGAGGLYSGKVLFDIPVRITDKLNGAGQSAGATATDVQFQFGIQCSTGNCSAITSTDSVIPDMARETKRAVWELGKIQVQDGGPDGDLMDAPSPAVGTCPPVCAGNGGETVFLTQGLLAP